VGNLLGMRPRRQRIQRIRTAVAAGSIAAFLATFGGLYAQLATGNDPALGATVASATEEVASSPMTSTLTSSDTTSAVSPVTTRQS
jgi:hypothetical protein